MVAVVKLRLATADFETDPFVYGRPPVPFSWGLYDGSTYVDYWGDDCQQKFIDYLADLDEPLLIYFHNGGGFDFWYLIWWMEENAKILDGKIVKGNIGPHELRDSFKILPFPLAQYQKDKIDYTRLERNVRNKHKSEILKYQKSDCVYLYDLVSAFHDNFGNKLTVGGASMTWLQELCPFDKIPATDEGAAIDAELRKFYFGGRNQCFKTGVIKGNYKIFDMNSNYLCSMNDYKHPSRLDMTVTTENARIKSGTMFATIKAKNEGALPMRLKDGSLNFDVEDGIFHTTIHEIEAGQDTGTLKIEKVLATYDFLTKETFAPFVQKVHAEREASKQAGDKARDIAWKYVGNSAYGKTAQNPENYKDWQLASYPLGEPWNLEFEAYDWFVHSKPSMLKTFYNVAIGASITGGARAMLLRGLSNSDDPLYCDTDSIICKNLTGVPFDDKKLGAWKNEGEGDCIAIAGKKLYAVFAAGQHGASCATTKGSSVCDCGNCIKKASKGGKISGEEIRAIASGAKPWIEHASPAPNFKLDGTVHFTKRRFAATAKPQRAPKLSV